MIRKLRMIFTRRQKLKFLILFGMLFTGSVLEFLGVSLVLPFVQLFMEPEGQDGGLLLLLGRWFHVSSGRELLFLTGLLLAGVYILKNGYLVLMKAAELRFIFNNRLELAGRLMRSYMEKPYTFHLEKNSSEVLESVTFEVNKLYDLILYGMELVSVPSDDRHDHCLSALEGSADHAGGGSAAWILFSFVFSVYAQADPGVRKGKSDLQQPDDSGGSSGYGRDQGDQADGPGRLFCPRL